MPDACSIPQEAAVVFPLGCCLLGIGCFKCHITPLGDPSWWRVLLPLQQDVQNCG